MSVLCIEDRLGLIVDAEWNARKSNHLQRLIRQATFSDPAACLENVEYLPDRKLKKEELLRLGTCNYIHEHHNVILLGGYRQRQDLFGLCTGHGSCKTVSGGEIRPSAGSAGGIQHCPWQRNDPQTHDLFDDPRENDCYYGKASSLQTGAIGSFLGYAMGAV